MSFRDFIVEKNPSEAFSVAQDAISEMNFIIRRRIRDSHLKATGLRNLNITLFALLGLADIVTLTYSLVSPPFILLFLFFLICSVVAYFATPHNTIYVDIIPQGDGKCQVNLTSFGNAAEALEKKISSKLTGGKAD